jgi:hypothetical protein
MQTKAGEQLGMKISLDWKAFTLFGYDEALFKQYLFTK